MRKIIAIFAVVVLVFMLAACGKTAEPVMLYDANSLLITRQVANITVVDVSKGRTYTFTTVRKKARSAAVKQAQNVLDDGSLQIETCFNLIRVCRYDSQGAVTIYIKAGR